jgi:uncharacterized membrane protein YkvI
LEHIFIKSFGINKIIGSLLIAITSYFVFLKNIESITKINSIIIPALILTILVIGTKNIINLDINQIGINTNIDTSIFWILQAIIYASYNLILVLPVLINLKKFIKSRKQVIIISVMTGVIISIISILTFLLLVNVDTSFATIEMPVVYAIQRKFVEFKYIYGLIILIAIFTTAISVGISFLNNICENNKKFPQFVTILCISSIIISNIRFSNLVNTLFPLFGFLGLIQIYFIIKSK